MLRHRIILPIASLTILLLATFYLQPRAMSYFGLNLLFNLAVPIALATIAQMMIIMVNDIDLSLGAFVSLIACIAATILVQNPMLGYMLFALCILGYCALGVLIYLFNLPAIVVTLGMSFVWGGLALFVLPSPGGTAPEWIRAIMIAKPPFMPMAIVACILIGVVTHVLIIWSGIGVVVRGVGGNERALMRSGWSVLRLKALAYGLAGLFGVFAGITLVGLTTAADANIALRYTLLSIAGVILGGGEFVGGKVSPIGAVIGAMTLVLASSFLSFLRISSDWQIGAQGLILIIVLAARLLFSRRKKNAI